MIKVARITKRWILKSFIIIVAVLVAIEALVIALTHSSIYNQAQQQVKTRASVIQNTLDSYAADADVDFYERTRELIENFSEKNRMELVAIDRNKKPIMSSSGFAPQTGLGNEDLSSALNSDGRIGESLQKHTNGENIYCVTVASPLQSGDILALRLMASLEPADRQIRNMAMIYILIGVIIAVFILVVNIAFLHSIMRPVAEVEKTARRIAAGDFDVRIETKYKDELGDLCDIVNYMADELSQSENMKNEFISSVSHELRTPLTAIRGWGETLIDDIDYDKKTHQKGMNVIISETERLSSIVEDLLDFSKMQSGRFTIKKEKMDILAELEEAILAFSERAKREGIVLNYNEPEMLSPIIGDKNRIRQVFVNILDNAIKYSDKGGQVNVTAHEEYGMIYVTVEDRGCGISPEDLPKIKKKFYKGNLTRRGSGIGLAVVDEIVTMLGGTFEIKSQLGFGTTVTLTFPVMHETGKEA
ncbi:MAG: HAMP domain-containing sensor histidine kinase [Oscillospiraceae bacterium]|nr:HAMP domain-containing sensor histidine kinase [Oscillospiraceae bacterium]